MDVEMQMEARGLPQQFSSTADGPVEEHLATNVAATMANQESATPFAKNDASYGSNSVPEPEAQPTTNGFHSLDPITSATISGSEVNEQKADAISDSTVIPNTQETPSSIPTAPSTAETSFTESVIPSSIPAEIISSESTDATSQIKSDMPEIASVVPEQPTSDLRTEPHSDALSAEAVSQIEVRKHEEDNAVDDSTLVDAAPVEVDPTPTADSSVLVDSSTLLDPDPSLAEIAEVAPSATSAPTIALSGLPNDPIPPTPPTPQPAAAELPTEAPKDSVSTPVAPEAAGEPQDQEMLDVLSPSVKVARERDEDQVEAEPAAKRVKTDANGEDGEAAFKVPEVPATSSPAPNGNGGDDTMTPARLAHSKKIISNLKKSGSSVHFRVPVDYVALKIPSYPETIKQPMDLSIIDSRLKEHKYSRVSDFVSDFNLIVTNAVTFNGETHGVTQTALKMQSSFKNQMQNMPPATVEQPSRDQKKAMKPKAEPIRTAPPRRPSVNTATPPATVPPAAPVPPTRTPTSTTAATPTFAVQPDGTPLIRRDSTLVDGRPKRAIVPTKRNSDFAGVRPKKKKYELQLRFCQEILKELASPKHWVMNQYFTHPVDPVALNIPTYFQVIRKPMDLGTIGQKLDQGQYEKAKDFEEDVRLVFKNCYKFNPDGDYVNQRGHELESLFNDKWAQKEDWIAAREPASAPESEVDDEDDDEDDEEEEDDSEAERNDKIAQLQAQIANMSKQMDELAGSKNKTKKSKSPTAAKKEKTKSAKDKPSGKLSQFPNLGANKDKKPKKKEKTAKPKAEKERFVSFQEKQYISNGIGMLPEQQMAEALRIIQESVPNLTNSETGEVELDIEEVPNSALLRLLKFIQPYAGPLPSEPKVKAESFPARSLNKSKKNKPMSKEAQEEKIQELNAKLNTYHGPVSPNAMESIEGGAESSDDDAESEESEED